MIVGRKQNRIRKKFPQVKRVRKEIVIELIHISISVIRVLCTGHLRPQTFEHFYNFIIFKKILKAISINLKK